MIDGDDLESAQSDISVGVYNAGLADGSAVDIREQLTPAAEMLGVDAEALFAIAGHTAGNVWGHDPSTAVQAYSIGVLIGVAAARADIPVEDPDTEGRP